MKRLVAGILSVLLGTIGTALVAPTASASSPPIDRGSLESVRQAYLTWLYPTLTAPQGWDGDARQCVNDGPQAQPAAAAGTFSDSGRESTLAAINYYRAMAGLQPVLENQRGSELAQQAALIMYASRTLTHHPASTLPCYSVDGYAGASTSNLASGVSGAPSVVGMMDDYGTHNEAVGHRRWLLHPVLSEVGIGSTSTTTSIVVTGSGSRRDNSRPSGGTAWPSAGYLPWEVAPSSGRWSYSAPGINFGSATVSMTRNGQPWTADIIARGSGYGDPALVWQTAAVAEPKPGEVDVYDITAGGIPGAPVRYQVKVFRAAVTAIGSVTIEGGAEVGAKLTVRAQDVTPADAALDYRWYADGVQVSDSADYRVRASDAGKQLAVEVSARSGSGDWATGPSASSQAVTVMAAAKKLSRTPVPKVTGTAKVGRTLTAKPGSWKPSGVGVGYKWYRNGAAIDGATDRSYLLQPVDKGKRITVRTTGSKPGYRTVTRTSKATKKVTAGTLTAAKPKITGTAVLGTTLTAEPGTWKPADVTLAYQWYRNGKKIRDATKPDYTLTERDLGKRLTVKVTGKASGYATRSKTSTRTSKVG